MNLQELQEQIINKDFEIDYLKTGLINSVSKGKIKNLLKSIYENDKNIYTKFEVADMIEKLLCIDDPMYEVYMKITNYWRDKENEPTRTSKTNNK